MATAQDSLESRIVKFARNIKADYTSTPWNGKVMEPRAEVRVKIKEGQRNFGTAIYRRKVGETLLFEPGDELQERVGAFEALLFSRAVRRAARLREIEWENYELVWRLGPGYSRDEVFAAFLLMYDAARNYGKLAYSRRFDIARKRFEEALK